MTSNIETLLPCRQLTALEAELLAVEDLAQLPMLATRIRALGGALVRQGVDGLLATRLLSAFNDRLTCTLVGLTAQRHRLPQVAWCWLALGSEGREEQTLVTDQDNALVFSAADEQEAEALRELFLPFAQEVNRQLDACGFALCPGGIMAGNPAWCLSLDEWQAQFMEWVRRPEPLALLNASIFFDLRPLHGAFDLGMHLRKLLLALTTDTPAFLHLMAANALHAPVPLGFRNEVVVSDGGTIDLKKFGSRIFVDAARIFALATGCSAVASTSRLCGAGPDNGLPDDEIAAVNAAFSHVLRLRLAQQMADTDAGRSASHDLRLANLNEIDQVILRESLKQARHLQQRLKLNYAL